MAFTIVLSNAGPQGIGGGVVPFGFYKCVVKKAETKPVESGANVGFPGTTCWCEILEGTDADYIGSEIRPYIVWPEADKAADMTEDKLNAMTARARSWLIASAENAEKAENSRKHVGPVSNFDPDQRLVGKVIYVMHDPADPAKSRLPKEDPQKEYDDNRPITEEQFVKALSGQLQFTRKNTYGLDVAVKNSAPTQSPGGTAPSSDWTPPAQTAAPTQPVPPNGAGTPQQAPPPQQQPAPAAGGGGLL